MTEEEKAKFELLRNLPPAFVMKTIMQLFMVLTSHTGAEGAVSIALMVAEKIKREAKAIDHWDEAKFEQERKEATEAPWPERLKDPA